MSKTIVSLSEIEKRTTAALISHGAEEWVAKEVAKAVRLAEATGNLICGLYYLESYCMQLLSGRVNGKAIPEVFKPKPGSVLVDAKYGFSQAAFCIGLPNAIKAATENGIALLGISHAHTCTSLGFFTKQIAESGFVGIGFANASSVVAPPGGKKPVLGTHPIAMSVPKKGGGILFQFDQSTSAVALGKITKAKAAGEAIPLGWAVDSRGDPTSNPSEALKGSLVSTGGYKGWGFGLMVEVMAAALTGSVNSLDVKGLKEKTGPPHDLGQTYILIDPTVFTENDFWDRIKRVQTAVNEEENARLPGDSLVYNDPVEIDSMTWARVLELS
jgi:(2R)-3-sulfolactate dehydrogenase (NADP+)